MEVGSICLLDLDKLIKTLFCCYPLQIVVDNPQAGTYTAYVIAHELVDDQSFALVVSVVPAHSCQCLTFSWMPRVLQA